MDTKAQLWKVVEHPRRSDTYRKAGTSTILPYIHLSVSVESMLSARQQSP